MIIREIRIDSFGTLRNRTFTFTEGLNVVQGRNESGKSAMAMFIKFMLYGLSGTPKRPGDLSEREKYVNWESGRAAGVMLLADEESTVSVERVLIGGESVKEMVRVSDGETGEVLQQAKDLRVGELLFGVPESVFVNTVFIGQPDDSRPGDELLPAIENLLDTASENVSADAALERLAAADRTILDKNDTAGLLVEKRKERRRTAAALTELRTARQSGVIPAADAPAKSAEAGTEGELEAEIEKQEKHVAFGEISLHKQQFEKLHAAEAQVEKMSTAVALRRAETRTTERLAEIDECESSLVTSGIAVENAANQMRSNGQRLKEALARQQEIDGATARATEELKRFTQREQTLGTAFVILGILSVIAVLAAFLLLMRGSGAYGILFIVFGVLFAGSLICVILKRYAHAKDKEFLNGHGAETPEELSDAIAEECGGAPNLSILQAEKARLDLSFTEAAEERHATALTAYAIGRREGIESDDEDAPDDEEHARGAIRVLRLIREKIEEEDRDAAALDEQRELLEARVNKAREQLSGYDEAEIRRAFEAIMTTEEGRQVVTIDANRLEKAKVKLRKLREELGRTEEASDPGRADAPSLAAATDPTGTAAALTEKLARLDGEIAELTLRHEAYAQAIRSIREAADAHRSKVLPEITARASELARQMSGNAFEALGLDDELHLTVTREGRTYSAETLSAGTRDVVYIALRCAAADALFEISVPPLVFDESFTRMDENRLRRCFEVLRQEGLRGRQSIVMTCRETDGKLAAGAEGVNLIALTENEQTEGTQA